MAQKQDKNLSTTLKEKDKQNENVNPDIVTKLVVHSDIPNSNDG